MNHECVTFRIGGQPAAFATAGEKRWKDLLEQKTPRPSLDGREAGLMVRFMLSSLAPQGQPLDLDNLCEPLFSVLVNRVGWFGGARPNVRWWRASKDEGSPTGCEVIVTADEVSLPCDAPPLIEGVYTGPLPRNARERDVADWTRDLLIAQEVTPTETSLSCYLGFASSRINIGNVTTGVVKSFIDCLYPILGGGPGSPADHRIAQLTVAKGFDPKRPEAVILKLWPIDQPSSP